MEVILETTTSNLSGVKIDGDGEEIFKVTGLKVQFIQFRFRILKNLMLIQDPSFICVRFEVPGSLVMKQFSGYCGNFSLQF